MTERTNTPLEVQIKIASQQALRSGDTLPLWQLLLDGYGSAPTPGHSPACPRRSTEVAAQPDGMEEALNRLKTLEEWLDAGFTVEQFYECFGPPKGVEIND